MEKIATALLSFTVDLVLLIFQLIIIKVGWNLFVVPTFGLPALTWFACLGLCLLLRAYHYTGVNYKNKVE